MGAKHFSGPMFVDGMPITSFPLGLINPAVNTWFVDNEAPRNGDGKDWDHAFATMQEALNACDSGDHIYWRGWVDEQCTGSNLKFDVSIIACGSQHHADQPSAAYKHRGAIWSNPVSGAAATTPLLKIRGRGWKIIGGLFDCPVDQAAIYLDRNALAGTSEYDASHAVIYGCDFRTGKYGIYDAAGCFNIRIYDCDFFNLFETGGCAIYGGGTAVALPARWHIANNRFWPAATVEGNKGNLQHIDISLASAVIEHNNFGTVEATAKYIDLTGGQDNMVMLNTFMGVYDTDDYVSATGDAWYQNACAVKAVTAPDGVTIAVPAAP